MNIFRAGDINIPDDPSCLGFIHIKGWGTVSEKIRKFIRRNNIPISSDDRQIRNIILYFILLCLMLKYCDAENENLYFRIHELLDEYITEFDEYCFNVRDKRYIDRMVDVYSRYGINFIYLDANEIDEPVTFRRYIRCDILHRIYDAIV